MIAHEHQRARSVLCVFLKELTQLPQTREGPGWEDSMDRSYHCHIDGGPHPTIKADPIFSQKKEMLMSS